MAELGDIKSARELGRSSTYRNTYKYIWHACVNCGEEKWVPIVGGKPKSDRCFNCGSRCKPPFEAENVLLKSQLVYQSGFEDAV